MQPQGPDAEFAAHLSAGRFRIQRFSSSGKLVFYPRVAEPRTGDTDYEWDEVSGEGTVYSFTVVRPRPPAEPYNVVLVDLVEGPRVMSRIEGIGPDDLKIGMHVAAYIGKDDAGVPIVLFRAHTKPDERSGT